jgi:hypothetical protein
MKLLLIRVLIFFFLFTVAGCMHSHVIEVTVTNISSQNVSTIVIDYPEATFGINSLAPGKSFHYKIKPTSTGPLKIAFINAQGQDRKAIGPLVHKGDEGRVKIKVNQDGAVSELKLRETK